MFAYHFFQGWSREGAKMFGLRGETTFVLLAKVNEATWHWCESETTSTRCVELPSLGWNFFTLAGWGRLFGVSRTGEKGQNIFWKRAILGTKQGHKNQMLRFSRKLSHGGPLNSEKRWMIFQFFSKEFCAMPEVLLTKLRLKCLLTVRKSQHQDSVMKKLVRSAENFSK